VIDILLLDQNNTKALAVVHSCCFEVGWDEKTFDGLFQGFGTFGWGAYQEGQLLGFMLARIVFDEAEILTFCVLPKMRQQGIGAILVQTLQEHAKNVGVKSIFLEVSVNNETALQLYQRLGFSEIATRPNYYRSLINSKTDAKVLRFIC